MIRKYFIVVLSVVWMNCIPVSAQPSDEISSIRQFSEGLVGLFDGLMAKVPHWVESAERHQLIGKLKDLRKDLYDLEQDKKFFLEELCRDRLDNYQLNRAINDINDSIGIIRTKVREVGLLLRESFQEGGLEVERILTGSVSDRKGWAERFRLSISTGQPIDPTSHIQEGREAVEALRKASIELTKLIKKLEEGA